MQCVLAFSVYNNWPHGSSQWSKFLPTRHVTWRTILKIFSYITGIFRGSTHEGHWFIIVDSTVCNLQYYTSKRLYSRYLGQIKPFDNTSWDNMFNTRGFKISAMALWFQKVFRIHSFDVVFKWKICWIVVSLYCRHIRASVRVGEQHSRLPLFLLSFSCFHRPAPFLVFIQGRGRGDGTRKW